mgnify:CR=1 FL=1
MGINRILIEERLSLIADQLQELIELQRLPKAEFLKPRNTAAAETSLRRSLEAIFDIGRHVLAKSGRSDLAQEYKSIAKGLKDLAVVSPSLGEKLIAMAGYRNRLVHLYREVAPEEVYDVFRGVLMTSRSS